MSFGDMGHLLKKHKEVSMPLFKITVKQSKNSNGIRIEKGMSVEVVSKECQSKLCLTHLVILLQRMAVRQLWMLFIAYMVLI